MERGQIGLCTLLRGLVRPHGTGQADPMFTIEHDFDATVVTLVDEGKSPLQEDVIINAFDDCVTVTQFDPRTQQMQHLTFSLSQLRDLQAALDLPEGVYQLRETGDGSA